MNSRPSCDSFDRLTLVSSLKKSRPKQNSKKNIKQTCFECSSNVQIFVKNNIRGALKKMPKNINIIFGYRFEPKIQVMSHFSYSISAKISKNLEQPRIRILFILLSKNEIKSIYRMWIHKSLPQKRRIHNNLVIPTSNRRIPHVEIMRMQSSLVIVHPSSNTYQMDTATKLPVRCCTPFDRKYLFLNGCMYFWSDGVQKSQINWMHENHTQTVIHVAGLRMAHFYI